MCAFAIRRSSPAVCITAAVFAFEPQVFGTAANNGQMIAEMAAGHRAAETFRQLAQLLTGRSEARRSKNALLSPLLEKLLRRQG